MSVEATTWVLRHSRAKGGIRLVLLALADHAHRDGTRAWPSVQTLADEANVSPRTAQRALRWGVEHGEIDHTGTGRNGVLVYSFPALAGGDKCDTPLRVTNATSRGDTGVTRTIKEPEEPSSSRSTTTTSTDLEAETENLLWLYETTIKDETGQAPARRPRDTDKARELAAAGVGEHFAEVIGWALADAYSRPRLLTGFAAAAKCFEALAAKYAGAPIVRCTERSPDCWGTFRASEQQACWLERYGEGADLKCPECQRWADAETGAA